MISRIHSIFIDSECRGLLWILLSQVIGLYYDRYYLDAYNLTKDFWKQNEIPDDLSTAELIWGGRLAKQLGSTILCYRLHTAALRKDSSDPLVQLYAADTGSQNLGFLGWLKRYEQQPRLDCDNPLYSLYWLIGHALSKAVLRDFHHARLLLEEAEQLQCDDRPWLDLPGRSLPSGRMIGVCLKSCPINLFRPIPKFCTISAARLHCRTQKYASRIP